MKEFDDYWEENWDEQDWAGCKRACRLCYEDAKKKGIKEGMLAAADIAESYDGAKGIAAEIRQAAEE